MNFTDFNIPMICWVAFVMIVWFESDIVTTIANLTNMRNLLKINEFSKYKLEIDVMSNYPNFLYSMYPGYLTKLLSCPICLCFWCTLFSVNLLTLAFGYHLLFSYVVFPINYIVSLSLYLIVRKLL